MREKTVKEIANERFGALPERLQSILLSDHMQTVIDEVVSKQGLPDELAAKLDNCTTFVILGLTHPKDFIRSLSETLGLDQQKASIIANEINNRVFRPVREDLKVLYGIGDGTSQTPIPSKPKSIDAELAEKAGLHPPVPPAPAVPRPKPLDAELSESMRKPTVPMPPVPPQAPRPRPAPSFVPPPPKAAPMPPTPTPTPWQKPQTPAPQAPRPAMPPAPKPRVFENSYGENHEENLDRDELLRQIENPSEIKSRPAQSFSAPPQQPPKEYGTDPYREPLN